MDAKKALEIVKEREEQTRKSMEWTPQKEAESQRRWEFSILNKVKVAAEKGKTCVAAEKDLDPKKVDFLRSKGFRLHQYEETDWEDIPHTVTVIHWGEEAPEEESKKRESFWGWFPFLRG